MGQRCWYQRKILNIFSTQLVLNLLNLGTQFFSPIKLSHIYFYLFVCCPLLNCTNVLLLLLLVVIFPLRRDFCWHVQDISRVQIFFFLKVAVFSIIICGEMSQGLLGFYIKRIKIRVFLDFVVIVFRGSTYNTPSSSLVLNQV